MCVEAGLFAGLGLVEGFVRLLDALVLIQVISDIFLNDSFVI